MVKQFISHCDDQLIINTLNSACLNALGYIEKILVNDLILGADWRDVREDLNDKAILTNACLLYEMYRVLGMQTNADKIKEILQTKFWNGEFFNDFDGNSSFDILGNALAIQFEITSYEQRESILKCAMNLSNDYGIRMTEVFLPPLNQEEKDCMAQDQAVIWPFTNGFMLNAMITRGGYKWYYTAKKEFDKWEKLKGFYEWYSISNGKGYGSENQVWSASLYLRVRQNLSDYILT